MITIYTLTYNEELLIQFMIDHYRERFPNCKIVVYDSGSSDNTIKIAKKNGCEVRIFNHLPYFQELKHVAIKNSCWKDAKTDWVLTSDLDDLLDISADQLKSEEKMGTTIIRSEGYDMVNMFDNLDLAGMNYGVRDEGTDKYYLFNKKYIKEMNYGSGCHTANPTGKIKYSKKPYKLFHYSYINVDETVKRYKLFRARIDPKDSGNNYLYGENPKEIQQLFIDARKAAKKIR